MNADVAGQVRALRDMTIRELQGKWQELFGEETRTGNRQYLIKRLAWRIQTNAAGDISEQARRRAEELANEADIRLSAPKAGSHSASGGPTVSGAMVAHDARLPMPGTLLSRAYKGRTVQVEVMEDGFEYDGEVYRSLSAVAKAVTGAHWNGYHFFNLPKARDGDA